MELLKQLLNHNFKLFVYATGAGAGIQKDLWSIPGCSAFLVGSEFTYDPVETIHAIGHEPESFCSKETSIELAMAAYMRAYNFNDSAKAFVGLGLTASVASTREHRGDHRIFVTVISEKKSFTYSAVLKKGVGEKQRDIDGALADELAETALLSIFNLTIEPSELFKNNVLVFEVFDHSDEELVNLVMNRPYFKANGSRAQFQPEIDPYWGNPRDVIFYPGTFNPFHLGHKGCFDNAEAMYISEAQHKPQMVYSTCINPAHKPPPTATDLLKKASQMKGNNFLLTKDDALYIEKARAFPYDKFVIGADALLTLLNPKWTSDPKALIDEFVKLGTCFYVAGRVIGDQFVTLSHISAQYPNLLPENNFKSLFGRWDISSTELRNQK